MTAAVTSLATTFAAIAWNPEIRNILSVGVGVLVLMGSVYLLVGTNVGLRTGLLVTLCGFFGWMATMGVVWWIYGIGYGVRGQGSGKMPGFSQRPGEDALYWLNSGVEREPSAGMLTPEMVESIVEYERELESADAAGGN